MVNKIMIALEVNDSALDAAQAKADKLVETLERAEALMSKLDGVNTNNPSRDLSEGDEYEFIVSKDEMAELTNSFWI